MEHNNHILEDTKNKARIFEKFKVKDLVFLAIIAAITTLTCAVMPAVIAVQHLVFGVAQLVTTLQITLFYTIGMLKVRKVGMLVFMSIFMGLILLAMSPAMFFSNLFSCLIVETLVVIIFRGYKKDIAIHFAITLFAMFSLPFNYIYNKILLENFASTQSAKNVNKATDLIMVAEKNWGAALGISVVVLAIAIVGTLLGAKIFNELKRSGAIKK